MPAGYAEMRALAATYTKEAVKVLANALTDDDGRVRIKAAEVLLERAWGKAAAAPEDLEALRESSPLSGLTPEQLVAIAKGE